MESLEQELVHGTEAHSPSPGKRGVGVQRGAGSLQRVDDASPARSSTLWIHRTERRGWTESIQLRGQDGGE